MSLHPSRKAKKAIAARLWKDIEKESAQPKKMEMRVCMYNIQRRWRAVGGPFFFFLPEQKIFIIKNRPIGPLFPSFLGFSLYFTFFFLFELLLFWFLYFHFPPIFFCPPLNTITDIRNIRGISLTFDYFIPPPLSAFCVCRPRLTRIKKSRDTSNIRTPPHIFGYRTAKESQHFLNLRFFSHQKTCMEQPAQLSPLTHVNLRPRYKRDSSSAATGSVPWLPPST